MQKRIIIEICICLLALQLAAYFVFNLFYANTAFPLVFLAVPMFFLLDGIVLARFAKKHQETPPTPAKLLSVKMIKLFGVIIVFIIGIILYRDFILFFGTSLMVFYLFYLLYETIILLKLDKK
ncbi:MAG: hypothetical protein LBN95_02280 [Prevotellaceae bacterium]|jgi:hypothetical protein|nr:hypothetical protein [Prevotellaceae bacterium]